MDGEFLQKYRQGTDTKRELRGKETGYLNVSECICVCACVGVNGHVCVCVSCGTARRVLTI